MFKNLFGKKDSNDDLYRPRMPEIDLAPNIEEVFTKARAQAAGDSNLPGASGNNRYLVLVTPGRMLMNQPCPPAGSMPAAQVASIEQMLPSKVQRNIAVIAYTELRAVMSDLAKTIPFAGMLMGLAYVGHAVWIFEGHPSALAAGCRSADLLIVDGGMAPYLGESWAATAAGAMRHPQIYMHDRATYKLGQVKA